MKQLIALLGLLFLVSSCIKNNPDPVWIEINEWKLVANPLNDQVGELSQNLSNAWVYVDGELVGVFELPCKIPVIYEGMKSIQVFPAIWNNGISSTKKIYPFMDYYEVSADFVPNQTITLNPVTRYKTNVNFWVEDFELAGSTIQDDVNSLAQIQIVAGSPINGPYNGNQFGRISLSTAINSWVGYSDDPGSNQLQLPKGKEVYLEIDYHNTNRVTTGLLAVSPSGTIDNPNIQLNPQDAATATWKKIYIDLREIIAASASGAYYQLSFQALLDEDDTEGEINIDNIKVVYF